MAQPTPTIIIADMLGIGSNTGFGLTDVVSPIAEASHFVRDWNGVFHNTAAPEFRLYSIRISSSNDGFPPALAGLWPGTVFTVVPMSQFSTYCPTGQQARTLERDPYEGSVRAVDKGGADVPCSVDGRLVSFYSMPSGPVRILYRPVLEVFVAQPWTVNRDEHTAEVSWDLYCEETGDF